MRRLLILAALFVSTSVYAAVVQPVGASPQVLIPAAGSTAGANGTFFRSDITLVNLANHDQAVLLQWLPQAGNGTASSATVTIPALTGTRSADFVSQFLNQTGLGAIIVTGVTSTGTLDTTARLFVNARIWSAQQPVANKGTVSQTFPAIPLSSVNTGNAALFSIGGADNAPNYRVNIGIVNLDPLNAQTFAVADTQHAPQPISLTVTLPPMTMQQIPLGSVQATEQVLIQNTTAAATRSNAWTAYSSTIDNVTGDSWSELAVSNVTTP